MLCINMEKKKYCADKMYYVFLTVIHNNHWYVVFSLILPDAVILPFRLQMFRDKIISVVVG